MPSLQRWQLHRHIFLVLTKTNYKQSFIFPIGSFAVLSRHKIENPFVGEDAHWGHLFLSSQKLPKNLFLLLLFLRSFVIKLLILKCVDACITATCLEPLLHKNLCQLTGVLCSLYGCRACEGVSNYLQVPDKVSIFIFLSSDLHSLCGWIRAVTPPSQTRIWIPRQRR